MPPMLALSPVLVDQSFPRDVMECRRVAVALAAVHDLVEADKVEVLLTETIIEICQSRDAGSGDRPYGLLRDIFALVDTWLLRSSPGIRRIYVGDVQAAPLHPLPSTCGAGGLAEIWQDEMGRVKLVHDAVGNRDDAFIGVACDSAFSGGSLAAYRPPNAPALPLVGPVEIGELADATEWVVRSDTGRLSVSVRLAAKHLALLGAVDVIAPRGGSHYKVVFPGKRPWMLDPNVDPVPNRFLMQLVRTTGYPLEVIKTTLVDGTTPTRRHRLAARVFGIS